MKTLVINLPDRKDRMQRFNANNPYLEYELFKAVEGHKIGYDKLLSQGFDTDHDWIDPLLKHHSQRGRSDVSYHIGIYGTSVLKRMNQ